jgi:DNA/RNA-binding domain of Phe-tRNA-synthetase-like protein
LDEANAVADKFIANSEISRNKLIQLEKEKENEPDNLKEILANSSIRYLKKAFIQLDIDTGRITTIEQLKERIAS